VTPACLLAFTHAWSPSQVPAFDTNCCAGVLSKGLYAAAGRHALALVLPGHQAARHCSCYSAVPGIMMPTSQGPQGLLDTCRTVPGTVHQQGTLEVGYTCWTHSPRSSCDLDSHAEGAVPVDCALCLDHPPSPTPPPPPTHPPTTEESHRACVAH
jgi:hypothetical protein